MATELTAIAKGIYSVIIIYSDFIWQIFTNNNFNALIFYEKK
jgi:hypothetical protein